MSSLLTHIWHCTHTILQGLFQSLLALHYKQELLHKAAPCVVTYNWSMPLYWYTQHRLPLHRNRRFLTFLTSFEQDLTYIIIIIIVCPLSCLQRSDQICFLGIKNLLFLVVTPARDKLPAAEQNEHSHCYFFLI